MGKTPSIAAGPASNTDTYVLSEDWGTTYFNVLANDAKIGKLYSLDNNNVTDLLTQDRVDFSEPTQLGASVWISADGRVGYSPGLQDLQFQSLAQGESIQDSFLYAVQLGNGSLIWSTVRVTIQGTNDAPVAIQDNGVGYEDVISKGTVAANDSDVDHGAMLRFAATGQPLAGFSMAADGSWSFDGSDPAYQGLADGSQTQRLVQYTVTDEYGASSTSFLTLTIIGTNDAPRVGAVAGSATEDGVSVKLDALADASDADAGSTLSVVGVPAAADLPAGVTYDPSTHSFTLDPSNAAYQQLAAGETSTVTVNYGVSDGATTTATSASWTVTGTNDGPIAGAAAANGAEDQPISGQLSASDPDAGAALTFSLTGDAPAGFTLASDGSWNFDASNDAYQGLAANEVQTIEIPFMVTDEHGGTAGSVLTLTLAGSNDTPVLADTPAALPEGTEDTAFTVTQQQLLAGWVDADGDELVASGLTAANATITANTDGSFTITPQANFNGELQLSYDVSDGISNVLTERNLDVTAVNDLPVRSGPAYAIPDHAEDQFFTITREQLLQGWNDADGDALSIVGPFGSSGGTFTDNGDGTYVLHPTADANGTFSLSYSVADGQAEQSTFLLFYLTPVNDPATVWGADAGSVTENAAQSSVSGDLYAYDVDNPNDTWIPVTTSTSSARGYGSFIMNDAGQWIYTLDNANPTVDALTTGQTLSDSFVVQTADGTQHTVSININGATDFTYVSPPVSTAIDPNDFDTLHADQTKSSTQFSFYGTSASEVIDGSNGNDVMRGQGGADVIYGHGGSDTLYGELASSNEPPLSGVPGNDTLYGQAGNDTLSGGLGSDTLYGGSGADQLYGNNTLLGSNPETTGNTLYGGSGNDRLYGDAGNDVLVGGTGADWLTGGSGSDRFVFNSASDTGDIIFDFSPGVDKIDLSALGLSGANFVGALPAAGMVGPGEVGYMVVQGGSQLDTVIHVDTDGVYGADLEVRLSGTSHFDASDIIWAG